MSDVIDAAVAALNDKLAGGGFDGVAKFVIEDEGSIIMDAEGARAGSDADDAEVTLTASSDTFRAIMDGDMNATAAFMTGKLAVDGNMGLAMKLGSVLA